MVTARRTHRGIAVLATLGAVAVLPGAVGVASADTIPGYRTANGATRVGGTPSNSDAPRLSPGLHTDSIKRGEKKYYSVILDDRTNAYFSAVAAPRPGTKVRDYGDKLTINVQDSSGTTCDTGASPFFHGGGMAYPIADYATRRIGPDRTACQKAGPYYLVLTRQGSAASGPDSWPIELDYLEEPPLKGNTPARPGQGTWSTATPAPRTDPTQRTARGGTGFNDAGSVTSGVWTDRIRPGETRFYRVPVDWGQRLNLSAELPNATGTTTGSTTGTTTGKAIGRTSGFIASALGLGVYNPARGAVGGATFVPYRGEPAAAKQFTAPVDYGNRFNPVDAVSAMRFAGWYYLAVSLHPDAARYFPKGTDLTLRVDVRLHAKAGPGYTQPAGIFSVTPEDRETARKGQTAQEARETEKSGVLMTVAYAGIGTGVVLLAGLGTWTLVARRSAPVLAVAAHASGEPAAPPAVPGQSTQTTQQGQRDAQFGPPRGW
ncbi:hypothetical protein [Streptomyces sp. NBC_01456]|uniref:hypothetical protein n=1 Tax=Streptomyces sp. NBC_01456 TaxID=2975868 RepID=UPI002E360090|nr:hypothetical protein [Streptomyces sp. NBC_01456]